MVPGVPLGEGRLDFAGANEEDRRVTNEPRGPLFLKLGIACVVAVLNGCSADIPGDDPGAVGGTGEIEEPPSPSGLHCSFANSDLFTPMSGWVIECSVPPDGEIGYTRDGEWIVHKTDELLTEYFGGGVCCEGCGNATESCEELCKRFFCEQARKWHNEHNGTCSDCSFDMLSCLHLDTPLWMKTHQILEASLGYTMSVRCSDIVAEWVEYGQGESCADPAFLATRPFCQVPEESEIAPTGKLADYQVVEDAGTLAELSWSWETQTGTLRETDSAVKLDYSVGDCTTLQGECLTFARLEATAQGRIVEGLDIDSPRLFLIAQTPDSIPITRGSFAVPAGALEVLVSFHTDGMPVLASVSNAAGASGSINPQSNALTLYGLRFPFNRFGFRATASLDLSGEYVSRLPETAISIANSPTACAEPVAFRAVAADLDGGPLRHVWSADNGLTGTGALFEYAFTAGTHVVRLTTIDMSDRVAGASLVFTRRCT